MTQKSWYEIKARGAAQAEVFIYDEIGAFGVSAKQFAKDLKQHANARQIDLRINSPGGSVFDGNAIYNQLKQHPAKITAHIDGIAASMASVIAMAADHVVMPENALMMIHNPWSVSIGDSEQLRKDADLLDKVKTTLVGAYGRSGLPEEELIAIMDAETWLTADEALEHGFIDEVREEIKMAACTDFSLLDKFEKTPEAILKPDPVAAIPDATQVELQNMLDMFNGEKAKGITLQGLAAKGLTTVEAVRNHLLNELGKDARPSSGAIAMNHDDHLKDFFNDATDAILARNNVLSAKDLSDGARELAGMNTMALAERFVNLHGTSTVMLSKRQILDKAFAMHSTSDFGQLLGNVAGKTLRRAYEDEPASHTVWTAEVNVPDFKEQTMVQLSEAPDLLKVPEGAEYKHGSFGDAAMKFKIEKFGRLFSLTREAIINDDLQAFTRLPMAFGKSARRKEADLVYQVLTGNPKLADGKALFHADHNNLMTASGISVAALDIARQAMRKQKGLNSKAPINIVPRFLIVPAALEGAAEVVLNSIYDPDSTSPNKVNLNFIRNMELVVDPRLDEVSESEWYVAASPAQVDTVTRAYLQGEGRPHYETRDGWSVDGLDCKARMEFAAFAVDYRGLIKVPDA